MVYLCIQLIHMRLYVCADMGFKNASKIKQNKNVRCKGEQGRLQNLP